MEVPKTNLEHGVFNAQVCHAKLGHSDPRCRVVDGVVMSAAASPPALVLRTRNFYHARMGGDRVAETVPLVVRMLPAHLPDFNARPAAVLSEVMHLLRVHLPRLLPQGLAVLATGSYKRGAVPAPATAAATTAATTPVKVLGGADKGNKKQDRKRKRTTTGASKQPEHLPRGATSGTADNNSSHSSSTSNVLRGDAVVATVSFSATDARYAVLSFRPAARSASAAASPPAAPQGRASATTEKPKPKRASGTGSASTAPSPPLRMTSHDVSPFTVVVDVRPVHRGGTEGTAGGIAVASNQPSTRHTRSVKPRSS